ncbi:MAG TPA: peptidylprolyl isomerase [Arachidicoccus sp.]
MSIIQKIQDKGAWIISILIGIALVAFIMMDYSKGGNMFSNTSTVGKVNGDKIDLGDFNQKVDLASQQMQSQGQSAPREAVQENVWNYLVQSSLLNQAYEKLGLVSTQRDINDAFYGSNPPQQLRQAFTDPQTGQYNAAEAQRQIEQMKRRGNQQQKDAIAQLINQTTEQVLVGKYQTLLVAGVYVPSWLAGKMNADNNSIAKMSYVAVPYSTVSDSAVKVTDEDINAYVAAHEKIFEQKEETRALSVISFNAGASSSDTAAILESLNNMKHDFITAPSDSAFVASKGGMLPYINEYISAKEMQVKQIPYAEVLNTPIDSTYGPYVFNGNYILAKMISKVAMPDSVKVRHILVGTAQQDPQSGQYVQVRSDSDALKRLDSAIAAIKAGASFDSIAQKYSDDGGSATKGGVIDYFTSGQMLPEFNDFAFTAKTGDTKVVRTQVGYHYIEILGQTGATEGYKIASVSKSIDAAQTTIDSVDNVASSFVAANQTQKDFEASAQKKSLTVIPVPGLKENDYQVGNFGANRELIKWAYTHKVGEVSQPVHIGTNVIVATLISDTKAGLPDANAVRPYLQTLLANRKKAKIITDSKFKGSTLESYAQSSGVAVVTVDSLSFQTAMIPNVGTEPKVIGAAFNASLLNKASAPIAGNSAVFGIQPLGISAKSSLDGGPDQLKMMIKQTWLQQLQQSFVGALQKDAKIDDYRSKFF